MVQRFSEPCSCWWCYFTLVLRIRIHHGNEEPIFLLKQLDWEVPSWLLLSSCCNCQTDFNSIFPRESKNVVHAGINKEISGPLEGFLVRTEPWYERCGSIQGGKDSEMFQMTRHANKSLTLLGTTVILIFFNPKKSSHSHHFLPWQRLDNTSLCCRSGLQIHRGIAALSGSALVLRPVPVGRESRSLSRSLHVSWSVPGQLWSAAPASPNYCLSMQHLLSVIVTPVVLLPAMPVQQRKDKQSNGCQQVKRGWGRITVSSILGVAEIFADTRTSGYTCIQMAKWHLSLARRHQL